MKLKKMLALISLVFVSFFGLLGCAKIESMRIVNPDYSVIDELVITLDKSKLDKIGKYQQVKNSVANDLFAFKGHVEDWIDDFAVDYPDIHFLLDNGGIKCTIPETGKDGQFRILLEFAGVEYFRFFYGLDCVTEKLQEIMSSEMYNKAMNDIGPFFTKICNSDYSTEEMGLFLYKYYMFSDSGLMSGIDDFGRDLGLDESFVDKYSTLTNSSLDDVELTQIFTYPDDRIKSNADDVEVVGGMTFMSWDLSNKDDGFQMSMYYLGAKTISWYVLAFIISAISVVVIFFVIKNKYNKSRIEITKQEIENDER